MGVKVTFNDKKLTRTLNRLHKQAPEVATKALFECVMDLSAESSKRAPIESGDLRSNCHGQVNGQTVYQNRGNVGSLPAAHSKPTGSVGYSLPYALKQHEDLTMRHDRTDGYVIQTGKNAGKTVNMVAGGEAKYLEKPFRERLPRYLKLFEDGLKGLLKK